MKWLKRILTAILIILIALFLTLFAMLHNELAAIMSIELLREPDKAHGDGAVYTMTVGGGFYLDDFIESGGVENDGELIAFLTERLTRGLVDIQISTPELGCAVFTATDNDGHRLFARNYDFLETNTCVVTTKGVGERHATVSTVDLSFLGLGADKRPESLTDKLLMLAAPYIPLDGINDAGVACAINMSYQHGDVSVPTDQRTDKPDITSTTLLRLILDYADSVEEAVELAESYDMHDSAGMSFHYTVADSSGRSAVLQWIAATNASDSDGSARELRVIYSDSDQAVGELEASLDSQVVTNFILEPGYYDGEDEWAKHGYDRYLLVCESLMSSGGSVENAEAAAELLGRIGARDWYDEGNPALTVHSVVYDLTERTVLWIPNENFDDPDAYYKFTPNK